MPWWALSALVLLVAVWGRRWWLLLSLVVLAGWGRYQLALAPSPLAALAGQVVTVAGWVEGGIGQVWEVDGRRLGARLALAGERLSPGPYRLGGMLQPPRGQRNPGGYNRRFALQTVGVDVELWVAQAEAVDGRQAPWLWRARGGLLEKLRRGVVAGLEDEAAALQMALVLGERWELGEWREQFQRSGLAHLLALSGFNVAMVLLALWLCCRRLGLGRYGAMMAGLWLYLWLVGPEPSVLRAVVMAQVWLTSSWLGRGRDLWSSLCLSALVVLVFQPLQLFGAGFQLSYLATMSLLWFAPPLARRLPKVVGRRVVPAWLRGAVAAALAAQVLVLPVQLYYFGRYPLAGAIATPLGAALTALQLWGGMGAGALGLVGEWPAQALNVLVGVCAQATLALVQWAAALGALDWGRPGAVGLGYYAASALVALWWVQGRLRPRWAVLSLAALGTGALPLALVAPPPEVVCFDVGQGDSTLLRLPGALVLIDGGGSPGYDYDVGEQVLAPALRSLGVRYLDVVIATHADLDHIEGLISLARHLPVGLLVLGAAGADDAAYAPLLAALSRTPVRLVQRGEVWRIGAATLTFLNPPARPYPRSDNNNSVVVRLDYEETSLLIAGDIEAAAEADVAPLSGPAVVLRVAHHGAFTSSTPDFLRQVQTQVAVVSVGAHNPFGHPHPAVLERLGALGTVWRTDQGGALRLALNGRRDLQELGAGPWLAP